MLTTGVTELLGVEIPLIQAPMGWIARAPLASAVSNAGAMGIIETSSGELDVIRDEVARMKDLTDRPFGVNIAQAFVADPAVIVDFVIAQGVRFVTTSAGSPTRYTAQLKEAGSDRVPRGSHPAGGRKGGQCRGRRPHRGRGRGRRFQESRPVSTMVLLPSVTAAFDLPVVAAGGFLDGRTMAAALALGAEGFSWARPWSPRWSHPCTLAGSRPSSTPAETDTVFLNSHTSPALRALRTPYTERLEFDHQRNAMASFGTVADVYFGGQLEDGIALGGQVAGRIDASRPVAEIVRGCAVECEEILAQLARRYVTP